MTWARASSGRRSRGSLALVRGPEHRACCLSGQTRGAEGRVQGERTIGWAEGGGEGGAGRWMAGKGWLEGFMVYKVGWLKGEVRQPASGVSDYRVGPVYRSRAAAWVENG